MRSFVSLRCARVCRQGVVGRGSYGACFSEHCGPEVVGQGVGCKDVHWHSEQKPEFVADRADVEQGRLRRRGKEDVKVGGVSIRVARD